MKNCVKMNWIHKTVGNFQLDVISDTALLFVAEWSSVFEWIFWVSEVLNGIRTEWIFQLLNHKASHLISVLNESFE